MHSIHDLVSTRCFNRGSTRFDPNEGALDSVDSTRYSKRGSTRCDPHEVALDLVSTRYSNEETLDFDETRYQTLDFNQILVSLEQTLDFDKSSLGPGSLVGNREKKIRERSEPSGYWTPSLLPARLVSLANLIFFALFPTKEPGPRLDKRRNPSD